MHKNVFFLIEKLQKSASAGGFDLEPQSSADGGFGIFKSHMLAREGPWISRYKRFNFLSETNVFNQFSEQNYRQKYWRLDSLAESNSWRKH